MDRRTAARRLLRAAVALAAIAVLVPACSNDGDVTATTEVGTEVPEGYRVVEHRDASVALPVGWTVQQVPGGVDVDPDAVEVVPPTEHPDLHIGAELWRHGEPVAEGSPTAPLEGINAVLASRPGFAMLRDEEVEVPGADHAHLQQMRLDLEAPGGGDAVLTFLAAQSGARVVVLRLFGPEVDVPADVVRVAVETFRVQFDEEG